MDTVVPVPVTLQVVRNAVPVSLISRTSESDAEAEEVSLAVRVRVISAFSVTCGSVMVAVGEDVSLKATAGDSGSWDHKYVRSSPSGSVAEPFSAKTAPSARTRSAPARTVGAALAVPITVTFSRRQLLPDSKTSSPDAVTLTLYASCPESTEVRLSRFPPVISKWSESGPVPMP